MAERPRFDPYALLQALERYRVTFVVIGGFARILQGTEEMTYGLDITPSTREENLRRLGRALHDVGAKRSDGRELNLDPDALDAQPVHELTTEYGELNLVPEPAGTHGYDDLRRKANREPLGQGLRPPVASIGDLARMVSSLDDQDRLPQLMQLRRLVELERGRDRVLQR